MWNNIYVLVGHLTEQYDKCEGRQNRGRREIRKEKAALVSQAGVKEQKLETKRGKKREKEIKRAAR